MLRRPKCSKNEVVALKEEEEVVVVVVVVVVSYRRFGITYRSHLSKGQESNRVQGA
jgi:hypothetical protein